MSLRTSAKIGILAVIWGALLCGAVGLGFLSRPTMEKSTAEEVLRQNGAGKNRTSETVDVDYYAFYDANAIEFNYPWGYYGSDGYDVGLERVPQISGLKDEEVQNKINTDIRVMAKELLVDYDYVRVHIGDNVFNVLSIEMRARRSDPFAYSGYIGLNFDLTTGERLSFDDIFVDGANVEGMVFKRFYNKLSTEYSFEILDIDRGIKEKEAGTCAMYCSPDKSLEELYEERAAKEEKLANVEELALFETKQYLAGEKRFYLESAGPVFIYDNKEKETSYFTSDDVQYMAYLGKYRTNESIYADDSVGLKNAFLSSANTGNFDFGWIEENDRFLIDYMADNNGGRVDKDKSMELVHGLVDKVVSKSDEDKYLYIIVYTTVAALEDKAYGAVSTGFTVYEMDKDYYSSKFRKVVFDAKSRRSSGVAEPLNPSPLDWNVDKDKVTTKDEEDYDIPHYIFMDKDGNRYETVESIFKDGVLGKYGAYRYGFFSTVDDGKDWRDLLISYFYENVYEWKNGNENKIEYTEEEKRNHRFEFEIGGVRDIYVRLVTESEEKGRTVTVQLDKIPNEYLLEVFRHD